MKITRRFTQAGQDVFSTVEFERRTSRIANPDGSVVFEMNDAEIPTSWSQLATDIMVSKYFRKAGVPQPDGTTGPEKSAKQVIHRLAGCWRHWGEQHGYFDSAEDAQGAAVQIWVWHRLKLLAIARRERGSLRRRKVIRFDELLEDRRSRRRRNQVRRHDPSRGQDGLPRPRSPRCRSVCELEGARR